MTKHTVHKITDGAGNVQGWAIIKNGCEKVGERETAEEACAVADSLDVLAAVECMSTDQLDDWYEEHVGYRLSEDDPEIVDRFGAIERAVAEMMCLHEHGEGATYDALVAALNELGWKR